MSAKRNFYLGLFVIGGVALLVAALFAFGLAEMFKPKACFVTSFTESVQGLAVGSQVKYKGVPIGTVKKITLDVDAKIIIVLMEAELDVFNFGVDTNDDKQMLFYRLISSESKNGLRCTLEYSGITGMKYVEIDYMADPLPEEAELELPPALKTASRGMVYLPSRQSAINNMLDMINNSLQNIAKVDFEGISQSLKSSIVTMDELLGNEDIKKTLASLERASANFDRISDSLASSLSPEALDGLIARANESLEGITELSREVREDIQKADLGGTAAGMRAAMEVVSDIRDPLLQSIYRLNSMVGAVDHLVEQISANPRSLFIGNSGKEVDLSELK